MPGAATAPALLDVSEWPWARPGTALLHWEPSLQTKHWPLRTPRPGTGLEKTMRGV